MYKRTFGRGHIRRLCIRGGCVEQVSLRERIRANVLGRPAAPYPVRTLWQTAERTTAWQVGRTRGHILRDVVRVAARIALGAGTPQEVVAQLSSAICNPILGSMTSFQKERGDVRKPTASLCTRRNMLADHTARRLPALYQKLDSEY